jgi:hypothetical protein
LNQWKAADHYDNISSTSSLGRSQMILRKSQSHAEVIVRLIHVAIGLVCLSVAAWFFLSVSPFNYFGFFGFLLVGVLALIVGLFGSRSLVFQLLFYGGV